ncbi:MAG TPA: hypothetical protein VK177_10220 [Flavobacteriales bacterium]|nr:hypothetical protein [Flavobacteriales bacterium]
MCYEYMAFSLHKFGVWIRKNYNWACRTNPYKHQPIVLEDFDFYGLTPPGIEANSPERSEGYSR